ncbi:MAG: F0F1 ATP synthase subunit B [Phycisphaerales bacterium]
MRIQAHHLLALAAPLALAAAALAADPHAAGAEKVGVLPTIEQGIVPMIVSIVVFAVVFAILAVKVWPTISKGLADRENKIRGEIEAAEAARAQAKTALEGYERALADARGQAQKELDAAKLQATAVANDLKIKSEADLTAMKEKAVREIEAAKKQALADIYGEASNLATMVAGKILQREINAGDQRRLVDDCITELKGVGARA